MDVYIGFDISLQTTYACVVDREGKEDFRGFNESLGSVLHTVDWCTALYHHFSKFLETCE